MVSINARDPAFSPLSLWGRVGVSVRMGLKNSSKSLTNDIVVSGVGGFRREWNRGRVTLADIDLGGRAVQDAKAENQ